MPPRKFLSGINTSLSLGIRKVFPRFADAFLLENYLSSVRGKFQGTIFVSFKAFLRSYMYILQEKITPKGAKIVLETDMSSALFGYYNPYTTKTRDKKFCLGFKTIFKNGVIIFSFTVL